jgi:hypothetical protein
VAGPAGLIRRLLGAALVGVATLFQPKRARDQHWSVPPTWPVDDQATDQQGEP